MIQAMVNRFYYITHVYNLDSILNFGIYSHNKIKNSSISYKSIYEVEVINRRKYKVTPDGKSLLDYVNLYFKPRNPMLYRVINEFGEDNIIILGIDGDIIKKNGVFITDGNASSNYSRFYSVNNINPFIISKILENIRADSWYNNWRVKIELMAECLVPEIVENFYIKEIYVSNFTSRYKLKKLNYGLPVIISSYFFFKDNY
ncbi:MAG: DUF4433 domain-containing protein [bacterium]|jgi:hypothetical protein